MQKVACDSHIYGCMCGGYTMLRHGADRQTDRSREQSSAILSIGAVHGAAAAVGVNIRIYNKISSESHPSAGLKWAEGCGKL